MLTNSKGVLKDTSLIGSLPAHCSTSSCSSIVADFAYAPSVECHSWNSGSQPSVLEQEVKIAEGVCPQDHLLQAAQEVTSESGYITRKSDLEYLYLSRENTTFPSVHGSMSTRHPDWLLALPNSEQCTSSPSKGKSVQQCTIPKSAAPQMSMEQFYRVKHWVNSGTYGLASLPGMEHGAPLSKTHPEQHVHRLQDEQIDQSTPVLINIGNFLNAFPDSYVVPMNFCGFNALLTIDTGCTGCLASHLFMQQALGEHFYRHLNKYTGEPWFSADGSPITILGTFEAKIQLQDFTCAQEVVVYKSKTKECLFGARFLKKYDIQISSSHLAIPAIKLKQSQDHQKIQRLAPEASPMYPLLLKQDQVVHPLEHLSLQVYIPAHNLTQQQRKLILESGLICHSEEIDSENSPENTGENRLRIC